MKVDIHWLVVDKPEGKRMPEWVRSIAFTDRGQVFVPAAMGGDEQQVFMCLAWDNTEYLMQNDHIYVPVDWMAKEYPQTDEVCKAMLMAAQREIRKNINSAISD